ncbi:DUF485 domain-containing protein [Plantactinospora sp. S1510]|uniref:DUF485 domain-containing protein n=1 Tax=Plantactinospora alkalitolerans TaxID=2789879 RepID=A0ABS0H7K9_9ACTN|nr:DUF485 domain-containing protein [Plantactinospora alkalitolerans]MBF9134451.1 DUF485 domain-containing protein [Plantactinospora alkalitolerans]
MTDHPYDPRYGELRRRVRRFVALGTTSVIAWWVLLIALAGWAPDLLAEPFIGNVNVGLVLALAQLVSALAVTQLYLRFARTRVDPVAEQLRAGGGTGRVQPEGGLG